MFVDDAQDLQPHRLTRLRLNERHKEVDCLHDPPWQIRAWVGQTASVIVDVLSEFFIQIRKSAHAIAPNLTSERPHPENGSAP
ncbi:hypothetical protein MPL3365_190056 [Mesorhizobium plurifarium]|uniref:Uncharacterized protein n=1 Tax=Mesorhizobium plurifarium TaxID=69974 RepID=A0A090G0U8_MESPL|nr:hypothetical protein MPL3365_190056 [Mesorhizobium plurifarium]